LIGTVYDIVSPVTSFLLAGGVMLVAALAGFGLAPVPAHASSAQTSPPTSVPATPLP